MLSMLSEGSTSSVIDLPSASTKICMRPRGRTGGGESGSEGGAEGGGDGGAEGGGKGVEGGSKVGEGGTEGEDEARPVALAASAEEGVSEPSVLHAAGGGGGVDWDPCP